MGALPGHMAGLTTAPAQTRERTGWGVMARLAIKATLRRLTRIAHTAVTTFNTDKARNLLGKQDFHKTITIMHSGEIVKAAVIHRQNLTII